MMSLPNRVRLSNHQQLRLALRGEVGVHRASDRSVIGEHLYCPVAVCTAPNGDVLLIDIHPSERPLYLLKDGAVQRVRPTGLLGTTASVISIASAGDGYVAIVGDSARAVVVLNDQFMVLATVWRSDQSDVLNWPSYALPLADGIVIADRATRSRGAGLVKLCLNGDRIWEWRPPASALGDPTYLSPHAMGGLIVADPGLHQVLRVVGNGEVAWRHGVAGLPGRGEGLLSSPTTAVASGDAIIVCDSRNHRIVELDLGGRFRRHLLAEGRDGTPVLCAPMAAVPERGGSLVIADTGHRQVLRVRGTSVEVVAGRKVADRYVLSFPRSVQRIGTSEWLVADTNNDRVVVLTGAGEIPWQYGGGAGERLHWPRAARRLPDGRLVIADALNQRLIILSPAGRMLRQITELRFRGHKISLQDPHDVRPTTGGTVLVTDPRAKLVAEIDESGSVLWWSGPEDDCPLVDPHQSCSHDGRLVEVVDPQVGLIVFDRATGQYTVRRELGEPEGKPVVLHRPKAALRLAGGVWIVNEVPAQFPLVYWPHRGKVRRFSRLRRSSATSSVPPDACRLHKPRDIDGAGNTLTISDHEGHRLVLASFHLEGQPRAEAASDSPEALPRPASMSVAISREDC